MEFWLHAALMLIASTVTVLGRPDGAPEEACMTFIPGHANPPNMAAGDVPFYVNISEIADYYEPDETYTITLSGTAMNENFRGFLLQARAMSDDSPVGVFMTDGEADQQNRCMNYSGVTHTNPMDKETVILTWMAPPSGTGTIYIRYAFVDVYTPGTANVFWADQTTAMIPEAGAPTPTPTPTPTPGGSSVGAVAGTMLILMLSTIVMLIN